MNETTAERTDATTTPARPPWSLRHGNGFSGAIAGQALGAVIGRLTYDAFGDRFGLGAQGDRWAVVVFVILVVLTPWVLLSLPRPRAKPLPPIVPMHLSSPWRRRYRRYGWVPVAPVIALDLAVALGYEPTGLSPAAHTVVTAVMLLGPIALIYWSGDRHR